jgi:hypothetical protein
MTTSNIRYHFGIKKGLNFGVPSPAENSTFRFEKFLIRLFQPQITPALSLSKVSRLNPASFTPLQTIPWHIVHSDPFSSFFSSKKSSALKFFNSHANEF